MVATGRAKLHSQLRCPGARKLFRMHSWRQSMPLARFQDLLGLLASESAAIAEDVAEFGEFFLRDLGNECLGEQRDIPFYSGGSSAILGRDDMGAEERRDDVQRLFGGNFFVQAENFQLARHVEAVTALCLDRGGAVGGEL